CRLRLPRRGLVSRRDQRGVALIFVLWLLVLLGAAAAEVASRARSEALILSSFRARTVGRYAAESGILRATTRIEALLDSAPEPVLAALPAVGSAAARNIVQRRAAGEVFTAAAFGAPVSIMPTRLMLVSRGWQQGHPLTHEIQAVYAVVGPRLVLEGWEERDR